MESTLLGVTALIAIAFLTLGLIYKMHLLYFVSTIVWLIFAAIGYNVPITSNNYVATALAALGLLMAFIMAMMAILGWLKGRPGIESDEDIQRSYRRQVYAMTKRAPGIVLKPPRTTPGGKPAWLEDIKPR